MLSAFFLLGSSIYFCYCFRKEGIEDWGALLFVLEYVV
jgi:hypothetical protein